jgi:ferredoxin-type protein NapF
VVTRINRFQFLRGDFQGTKDEIRPPWSLAEIHFIKHCTRCGECLKVCPEQILVSSRGGFPQVDFRVGECTFCAACAERCPSDALDIQRSINAAPWAVKAQVKDNCLALRGVVCRTCGEQCEVAAIRFRQCIGGVAQPELSVSQCTGCGACFAPCPVQAIELKPMA